MTRLTLAWLLCLSATTSNVTAQFITVYMDNKTGTQYSDTSIRVEPSLSRIYSPNTNAWIVLKTPDAYPLWYVRLQRLDVEGLLVSGKCHDYLNIYNGNSLSSSRLNSAPLCSTQTSITTYYTTGRYLTLHFVSDATAELTGFEVIATAAIRGSCLNTKTQFQCTNSSNLCIAIGLRCDGFRHCANGSDEQVAMCQSLRNAANSSLYGIIIGSIVGFIVLAIILVFIIMYCVRERKYKQLLEKLRFERKQKINQTGPTVLNEYPVTNTYRKNEFKKQFIDEDITDKDWGLYYGPLYDKQHLAKIEKENLAEKQFEENVEQKTEQDMGTVPENEEKAVSQQGSHVSLKSGDLVSQRVPNDSRKPSSAMEMAEMGSETPTKQSRLPSTFEDEFDRLPSNNLETRPDLRGDDETTIA